MATREEFENGKCPHCGSREVSEEHNLANIGFLNGAGYFLDFPFGKNYECGKCGTKNDDACFVATAVYGDANAPQVQTLRRFRDEVLEKSAFGRSFVRAYYGGLGKATAKFVRRQVPSSIPLIRKCLDKVVEGYERRHDVQMTERRYE